jgi:hypothetical protein
MRPFLYVLRLPELSAALFGPDRPSTCFSPFNPCHPATTPSQNLQALAPNENLIEVLVSEAVLNPAAELAPDASTFVAWDFFLHDSQATPVLPGSSPRYNCTVRRGCCTVLGTVG